MTWTNGPGTGNVFIQFSYGPPIEPPKCECGKPITTTVNYRDGRPSKNFCQDCADLNIREESIKVAAEWMTIAFQCVKREHRAKLYRQLSIVFHPDAGGDARLMTALNAVRERFP